MLTPADLPPFTAIPTGLLPTLDLMLRFEGVDFEDDADDPGGATKCGVSLAYARSVHLDLNGDGLTTVADIEAMEPELAKRLIFKEFYLAPGVGLLPECVQPLILDSAFNCGLGGAKAILIAAPTTWGPPPPPPTLGGFAIALHAAQARLGCTALLDAIVRSRILRYRRLVSANQHLAKYLNGWLLRALHYASADFRQRYAALLEKYGEKP